MGQTIRLLCGRKHDQQRLLSNKQAAANKVETELASLLGWLAPGAAGYYGFAQLPAELKLQVQDIAERPERWTVGEPVWVLPSAGYYQLGTACQVRLCGYCLAVLLIADVHC